MENSFQTSFIPKKPIAQASPVSSGGGGSTSLFTVLATLVLIGVGVAAGGLFFYKGVLIKQKEGLSESLKSVRSSFEQDTIAKLELFDKRVAASKQVLKGHVVFSPMFELLGTLTLPSIQYTKFAQETTDKGFTVKMSGLASDYRSIALQADVFNTNKGRSFRNVVFSNLTKDKNNNVGFDVEFIVDPALLSYQKNIELEKPKQAPVVQAQEQEFVPAPEANPSINTQTQNPQAQNPILPQQGIPATNTRPNQP